MSFSLSCTPGCVSKRMALGGTEVVADNHGLTAVYVFFACCKAIQIITETLHATPALCGPIAYPYLACFHEMEGGYPPSRLRQCPLWLQGITTNCKDAEPCALHVLQVFGVLCIQENAPMSARAQAALTVAQLSAQYPQHMEPLLAGLPADQKAAMQQLATAPQQVL